MDGKRFGVGIAAGLLFGLAVIAASGNLGVMFGSTFASFGPANPHSPAGAADTATATATTTITLTQTSVASSYTTVSGQVVFVVTPGNASNTVNSGASSGTTTTTSGGTDLKSLQAAIFGLPSSRDASHFDSISQQPLLTNAVVLVPLLVAFLLGAVLYRKSNRDREEPSKA